MKYPPSSIYLSGNAKTQDNSAINHMYKKFFISFIVDGDTGEVFDVASTTLLDMTQDFMKDMFIGQNLYEDIDIMVSQVLRRYFGSSQKAIIAALKDTYNQYCMYANRKNTLGS